MKLLRIKLTNFRGVTESEVTFPGEGVSIVEGDNEVGKTSIAMATDLIFDLPDSSTHRRVRAVQPVGRDIGPEVEVEVATGHYRFVYSKRWARHRQTTLDIVEPVPRQLTGQEAHDAVKAILAETMDDLLWKALRIEQGAQLTQSAFDIPSLGQALDRAVGGERVVDQADDLWDRICKEWARYFTPSGQRKAERTALAEQVAEAERTLVEVEGQLRTLDDSVEEMARLISEVAALESALSTAEESETDLVTRAAQVATLRGKVAEFEARRAAANAEHDKTNSLMERRIELIDAIAAAGRSVASLQEEHDMAQPARAGAQTHHDDLQERLLMAREVARTTEATHKRAVADRDYRRQQIELEQFIERRDRVLEAQEILDRSESMLETCKVDDDLVVAIEAADREHAKLRAAADASAAGLEVTALVDVDVEIAGSIVSLGNDETDRRSITEPSEIVVPDVIRVMVRPGTESQAFAERLEAAHAKMVALCAEGDVESLDEARAVARSRSDAERDKESAVKTIRQDLRDLTLDTLKEKVVRLAARTTDYGTTRPVDPVISSDLESANAAVEATEAVAAEDQNKVSHIEEDLASAATELQRIAVDDADLGARLTQAKAVLSQAELAVADVRKVQPDDALETELETRVNALENATGQLVLAQEKLGAEDPDSVGVLLANARDAKHRAADELDHNREAQRNLRAQLDVRGEQGLAQQLDEAKTSLDHLRRAHERMEARADAADLLFKTFDQRRTEAHQHYIAPFRDRIEQLGRLVFGPTFSVELDDELRIARRTLQGVTVEFDQLSTGAQEQLGLISRLACAAIVSADGGAPVIVDDALGWTDPRRLERMGAAIAVAGRDCQIIVLTCTPGRYASVGNATVMTLA